MVSAALLYRQTKADHYQVEGDNAVQMPEYIPWTATSGPTGLRTILSKQVRGLVGSWVWMCWYVCREGVCVRVYREGMCVCIEEGLCVCVCIEGEWVYVC